MLIVIYHDFLILTVNMTASHHLPNKDLSLAIIKMNTLCLKNASLLNVINVAFVELIKEQPVRSLLDTKNI